MEPLNLLDVVKAVKGKLTVPDSWTDERFAESAVERVVMDSRKVKKGDLFFAFPGEKTDGHRFMPEAFKKGAVACVSTKPDTAEKPIIVVQDIQKALMRLAAWYRLRIGIPIIAITGSSGKSTTKEMTAHLLSYQYPVLKAYESYNNEIGVPLTILSWENFQKAIVLEMAMRGPGQIKELCNVASPTHGLITSIGEAHIGLLGSLEKIADAKGELLEYLPSDGVAFLNGEDRWTPYLAKKAKCTVRTYGFKPEHWIYAEEIEEGWDGFRFKLVTPFGPTRVFLPLIGVHNLLNFLGASAIALSLGMTPEKVAEAAPGVKSLHGRLILKETKRGFLILDDSYNANPSSVLAAIRTVAVLPATGRRILVFGDMLEQGKESEKGHRDIGDALVKLHFDALFAVGEQAKTTVLEAQKQGLPFAEHFDSKEALIERLSSFVAKGDVVLVKGSRGMALEKVVDALS